MTSKPKQSPNIHTLPTMLSLWIRNSFCFRAPLSQLWKTTVSFPFFCSPPPYHTHNLLLSYFPFIGNWDDVR